MILKSLLSSLTLAAGGHGGEANLILPALDGPERFLGMSGHNLLFIGILVSALGLVFGLVVAKQLKALPVHRSMREISELIYETAKTYLVTQGKFIAILWAFIAVIIVAYFGFLTTGPDGSRGMGAARVALILVLSLIGILGSTGVAWFGIRVNTFANSRSAFAALGGKPFPTYAIPLKAGMSIGTMLISVELLIMLCILLFIPADLAGPCFIGFAIGESLGASALRIAGGIFTKIADIGSDLMKIVFKIKEDDARNPGVIADCTGDNAGDSVGPSADGFETYGVTGVALITFILLAVTAPTHQVQLLVWIFAMRIMMVIASVVSYWINEAVASAKYKNADHMNFEAPLTSLVWLTSIISMVLTYLVSNLLISEIGDGTLWWKLATIITCGTLAGAIIPELIKVFTSTNSAHVREVVTASKEGGASLNILSGLIAGNFSAFWMGLVIIALMGVAYFVSIFGLDQLMLAPAVFAFGLVAFGFLGMGPVTIAVDSYGPVTDNAQSVYELSLIENVPNIKAELKKDFGFDLDFEKAKGFLEENDGAGNTFKATAKPVLIGTAVVGATTMIFSIIFDAHRRPQGRRRDREALDPEPALPARPHHGRRGHLLVLRRLHPGGLHRRLPGGRVHQAEHQARGRREGERRGLARRWSRSARSTRRRACSTSSWWCSSPPWPSAFANEFFFIGYLISIAIFGLFQAIFMANAGGAWDNAKKIVEIELKMKGTPLHDATVVGDTVGDPFKDTSSVAMNPIIKFTTLFGLLAVELAIQMETGPRIGLAVLFLAVALVFVWRSFYRMRIETGVKAAEPAGAASVAH